jgi:hypothetical protein
LVSKILIHTLNLKSASQYRFEYESNKIPKDIPSNPHISYKNKGWISWGDWLGTGRVADGTQEWMSFKDAKEFVLKLKLKGKEDWFSYSKTKEKPDNIPVTVNKVYAMDWKGWSDFLGNDSTSSKYLKPFSFQHARGYVQNLNLKGNKEWREFCKSGNKPAEIPANPDRTYSRTGEWQSWNDFLGKEK